MAKIKVTKEVLTLENGVYTGCIETAAVTRSGKVLLKIELENGTVFVTFPEEQKFGQYPYNTLFMAVDSDELDDIIGLQVQFTIENNTSKKTGEVFSNIRKIVVTD